jgi:hypothetical protein
MVMTVPMQKLASAEVSFARTVDLSSLETLIGAPVVADVTVENTSVMSGTAAGVVNDSIAPVVVPMLLVADARNQYFVNGLRTVVLLPCTAVSPVPVAPAGVRIVAVPPPRSRVAEVVASLMDIAVVSNPLALTVAATVAVVDVRDATVGFVVTDGAMP